MPVLRDILGQERAVSLLQRTLSAGRLPHALLFAGPAGVGKATTARALAAAMECERAPGEGCGECASCGKVAGGLHPDVTVLAPSGAGDVIAVDSVRAMTAQLAYPPHEGPARLVIFDQADRLNASSANALLKILEEPPARTHFVLVTAAPGRLLVTIRSRCQLVRFAPLSAEALAQVLAKSGVPADRAKEAAELSGGSAARAEELACDDALERRRARALAVRRAAHGDWKAACDVAADLAQAKEDLLPTLDLLALWYRDAAARAARAPAAAGLADTAWSRELDAEAAVVRSPAVLARNAAVVLEAQAAIAGFAHPQLALERLILTLRGQIA